MAAFTAGTQKKEKEAKEQGNGEGVKSDLRGAWR